MSTAAQRILEAIGDDGGYYSLEMELVPGNQPGTLRGSCEPERFMDLVRRVVDEDPATQELSSSFIGQGDDSSEGMVLRRPPKDAIRMLPGGEHVVSTMQRRVVYGGADWDYTLSAAYGSSISSTTRHETLWYTLVLGWSDRGDYHYADAHLSEGTDHMNISLEGEDSLGLLLQLLDCLDGGCALEEIAWDLEVESTTPQPQQVFVPQEWLRESK